MTTLQTVVQTQRRNLSRPPACRKPSLPREANAKRQSRPDPAVYEHST